MKKDSAEPNPFSLCSLGNHDATWIIMLHHDLS